MRRLTGRLTSDERGAAIAEFLLGLIPLVIAFALIFEFGRAFLIHQAAIKGVRDATRYLTRVQDPSDEGAKQIAEWLLLTGRQTDDGMSRWSSGSKPALVVNVDKVPNDLDEATNSREFRGPEEIWMVEVATNVELALPLGDVFALLGGQGLGTITYSVGDRSRHYGE